MKVSVDYKKRFEDTYICYYSRMSRFAKSYLIYEEDAENIVQDIFIEIWEKKIDLTAISKAIHNKLTLKAVQDQFGSALLIILIINIILCKTNRYI